jgi:hypothetical protein
VFVTILVILAVIVLERFLFKLMLDRLSRYRAMIVLLCIAVHIPFALFMMTFNYNKNQYLRADTMSFSKWKFLPMAILDLISSNCMFIGGGGIAPVVYLLLYEISTPVNLIIHSLSNHRIRYHILQWVGATVILSSIIHLLSYRHRHLTDIDVTHDEEADQQSDLMFGNSLLFIFGIATQGVSSLVKEKLIKDKPMDIYYMNAILYSIQFALGLFISPLSYMVQMFSAGTFDVHSVDQFSDNVDESWACILQGVYKPVHHPIDIYNVTLPNGTIIQEEGMFNYTSVLPVFNIEDCSNTGFIILGYLLLNITYSLLLIWVVTKYGTAMLHIMASLAIPFSVFVVSVYESHAQYWIIPEYDFILNDILAAFLITIGTLCYHIRKEPNAHSITKPSFNNRYNAISEESFM